MGSPTSWSSNPTIKTTKWNGVLTALEEIDTPSLNSITDDINTTNKIDSAIDALTNHVRIVVGNNERKVPLSSDHRKRPADVLELIRTIWCNQMYMP
ncbi:hypothetical protein EVAR_7909_1 [Eumeta japonica]|uniref:Uncharacterized protein n=1 Tax=Eumeta variegata TaxID=151549 RepID=A0A4C1TW60_EUMVA|nr:hypothetical protein EVAR_7909_1 [Eumeta japonica]